MPDERKIPTVAEVKSELAALDETLAGFELRHSYTIEDYPIGRWLRGQCELSIDHDRRRGWRTVKRTTDKFGKWCKPKNGTYVETPIVVVTGPGVPMDAAWLRFDRGSVFLVGANMSQTRLYLAPDWCKPRRTAETYTMVTHRLTFGAAGLGEGGRSEQQHTLEADPPELCDAWDVWAEWFRATIPALEKRIVDLTPVMC